MYKSWIGILLAFLFVGTLQAQEHTAWRNGTDGIYPDLGLLDLWPESGPEILWSFETLGEGHSSPVWQDGYIYTTGMTDSIGYLYKFTEQGELIYRKAYGREFTESYQGPRGTPVIAGDVLYLLSAFGVLSCRDAADGEMKWEVDLVKEYGGSVIKWGYNETPVIDGDVIFCTPGGKNTVIALDRRNGELIWKCNAKGELSAYCTPLLFSHNGRKILATHTNSHVHGIDSKSGKLLWSYAHPNRWSVQANTPLYHDGGLLIFSGYGKGSVKLLLNETGDRVEKVWENPMDSRMGGAVLIDGVVYASGDKAREWRAIDWESGKDLYTSTAVGKGAVISADNKLICYSERGELALVNVDPGKFDLVSKVRVTKGSMQHWAHPIIQDGVLYLRHGKALIAYQIK